MSGLLKYALEGEQVQVVTGMFVAVPIGAAEEQQETLAALESLDAALAEIDEACRAGDVQLYLNGQLPAEGTVATESVKEKVKLVLKKIWELIAKVIAACMALQLGFLRWLKRGGRGRPLHRDVYKAWLDFSVMLREGMGLFGNAQKISRDLFANVIKADKLQEKFGRELNNVQKDLLVKGPYAAAIQQLIGAVCEKSLSNHLREIATGFGQDYQTLQGEAHKVDQSEKSPPPGPGTGKDIVPFSRESLDRFSKHVDEVLRLSDSKTEQTLGELNFARENALKNKDASAGAVLPDDVDEAMNIALHLAQDMPYELALRYQDEYERMFKDTEKSLKAAEKRFTQPGDWIDEKTIEGEGLPAQTYLDRATLEAVRTFGKAIQTVAQSYAMIQDHFDSAVRLTEVIFDYVITVLKTFMRDFGTENHPTMIRQILRLERQRDELLKRMKQGSRK